MMLNVQKFTAARKRAKISLEDLAKAIERPGLNALSAVRNWSRGNFKPKPKPADIGRVAAALGVSTREIARFESTYAWVRSAPRKAGLVAAVIRGRDIDSAISELRFSKKRAAVFVRKALDAAIASAEENDADVTKLFVAESRVDCGPTIKRFQPKDRGRAHRINKRTSHIVVAVEEA